MIESNRKYKEAVSKANPGDVILVSDDVFHGVTNKDIEYANMCGDLIPSYDLLKKINILAERKLHKTKLANGYSFIKYEGK